MFPTADFPLPELGIVLRPFPFLFNYPIQEGVEFVTDVNTADDGSEQRVAVRNPTRPRRRLQVSLTAIDRDEAQHAEALLFGYNGGVYGVPVWQDAMTLVTDAVVDDTSMAVDSTDFRDLTQRLTNETTVPCLLWRAHDDWEPFLLASAVGDTVVARDAITRDWPAHSTIIVPLQLMALDADVETQRPARGLMQMSLNFLQAHIPLSQNAPCMDDDGSDFSSVRVRLTRANNTGGCVFHDTSEYFHEHNNSPAPGMPESSDPPAEWTLFGWTDAGKVNPQYGEANPDSMYPESKGLATGFAFCTQAAPVDMKAEILGKGIGASPAYSIFVNVPGAVPGVITNKILLNISSSFSGTNYAPPPGAPILRDTGVAIGTMMGGFTARSKIEIGSIISNYGLYDVGAPGGIAYYDVYDANDTNATVVRFNHGYCFCCRTITMFKGIKVVVEDVTNPTDAPGLWTYGAPEVTTHDFTGGDYADAVGAGAFIKVLAGGSTLFGQAHPQPANFVSLFENEWARVTVYLYGLDDVDHLQWMDHFRTMFVVAELVP